MSADRFRPWLIAWSELWNLPQLPRRIRVEFSPRLERSVGRCHPASGTVRLHTKLLDAEGDGGGRRELLREVLCHEAAHVAAYLLHGRAVRPHGREWAALMRAAGFEPRVRMPAERLPADFARAVRPSHLYEHRCPTCGAARAARRPVRRWRCRRCVESGLSGVLWIASRPSFSSFNENVR